MTHTPGPWHVHERESEDFTMRNVHGPNLGGGTEVCIVTTGSYEDSVERDNARLIAASPELLEALKQVIPWIGKMIADGGHLASVAPRVAEKALERAEAAIAKAEEQNR